MAGDEEDGTNPRGCSESESSAAGISGTSSNDNDTSTDPLLAKLLVQRIVGFLDQKPSDFAITLLPAVASAPEQQELPSSLSSAAGGAASVSSLSSEDRSLLETSTVLMHDPECARVRASVVGAGSGAGAGHLGLDARHLPRIARILRRAYFRAKEKEQQQQQQQTGSTPVSVSSSTTAPAPSCSETTPTKELFRITSCLLLIQPDHATAWADRRRCLLSLRYTLGAGKDDDDDETITKTETDTRSGDTNQKAEKASPFPWHQELDYLDLLVTQHSKA